MSGPVFVDTSALYAVLDRDDHAHALAAATFEHLLAGMTERRITAVTHSSMVVESAALVQHRLGMGPLRALLDDVVPLLDVTWVDADLHRRATTALLAAGRRGVSLVDWTSFEVMRARSITVAFAFDDDFADQGFTLLPDRAGR